MLEFGKGAIESRYDIRDYWYTPSDKGAFDWETGVDIEKKLGIKLVVKNQNGSGSCFHGDTPVLMEDLSYKPISKVLIGERVFTHTGRVLPVEKLYKKKWQGTTKRISLWGDYRKIEATQEHPFYAIKKPKKNRYISVKGKTAWLSNNNLLDGIEPEFITLDNLEKGDFVAMPSNNVVKDTVIHSFESDPDFLWLLGLYIAEGSIDDYCVRLSLHKNEIKWLSRIENIMARYGSNVTYSFKGENGLCISLQGKKWTHIFTELGGELCDKKKINSRLMFIEPSLQKCIFDGWNDGDGRKHTKCDSVVTTSYVLVKQMRTILMRNGYFSSIQKRKQEENKKTVWTLERSTTSRYSIIKDGYCFVQIKDIEHISSYAGGYVYNLQVAGDNSYQVNGIAVHNCGGQAWSYYGELLEAAATQSYEPRSARWIYSATRNPNGAGSNGRTNCDFVIKNGFALEKDAPSYDNGKPPSELFMSKVPVLSETQLDEALTSKALSYLGVQANIELFAQAIQDNNGMVLVINGADNGTWHSAFPQPPEVKEWGHFLVCVGACMIKGKKRIKVLNSWGDKIGDSGYQYIGEEYFKSGHVREGWTLAWDYKPAQHKVMLQKTIKLLQQLVQLLLLKKQS